MKEPQKLTVRQLAQKAKCDESNIRHYIRKGRIQRDLHCRYLVVYDAECRSLIRSIKENGKAKHPGRKKIAA